MVIINIDYGIDSSRGANIVISFPKNFRLLYIFAMTKHIFDGVDELFYTIRGNFKLFDNNIKKN